MAVYRENPYSQFNFLVSLGQADPNEPQAGFSEVSGLGVEVTPIEYRNGNERSNWPRKLPGLAKVSDVTLKRGLIGSTDLYDWIRQAINGDPQLRRDVEISLLSEDRQATVQSWKLTNAWPMKYSGPTLSATTNEVAMEELVLTCEGFETA